MDAILIADQSTSKQNVAVDLQDLGIGVLAIRSIVVISSTIDWILEFRQMLGHQKWKCTYSPTKAFAPMIIKHEECISENSRESETRITSWTNSLE